jgi:NTE family protein
VEINATDLGSGKRFPFYRSYFDIICADIDKYPVSRAVAASSAVPGLLSPTSLESFRARDAVGMEVLPLVRDYYSCSVR